MDIVLASTARERGGTWRHVEDVGAELRRRGHLVTIALLPGATELQAAADAADLAWRPLRGAVRRRADVWHLHLHDTFEPASLAALAARRPFGAAIVTEHLPRTPGSDPALAPGGGHRRGGDLARTAFKRAQIALSAATIVPSHGAARFMRERYRLPERAVAVAHNGVASLPATAAPPTGAGLEVVCVGALVAQKGHDVLLAAAGRSRHPWRVTIVGAGPLRAELERTAEALAPGRVRFVGWTDDPAQHMRAAHVLCMPSRYESFGYAAVEAGALGRPVVGTRIDGLDEIVELGRSGLLVEPGNPDALAAALDGLWGDLDTISALGRVARERALAHFTIGHCVDALLDIYERAGAAR